MHVGGVLTGTIPLRCGIPQGSAKGPLMFLLDALLALLLADDAKLVTPWTQNLSLHSRMGLVTEMGSTTQSCYVLLPHNWESIIP